MTFYYNLITRNIAKGFKNRSLTVSRSGHSSTHSHAKGHTSEPYAVKHHPTQPSQAYAFGREPGAPLEGWEFITFGTIFICSGILIMGKGFSETDNFQTWARKEAIAREAIRENGGEIEYGKYYTDNKQFVAVGVDTMPVIEGESE